MANTAEADTGPFGRTLQACLGIARWTVPIGNELRKPKRRVFAFDAVGYASLNCCGYRRGALLAHVRY